MCRGCPGASGGGISGNDRRVGPATSCPGQCFAPSRSPPPGSRLDAGARCVGEGIAGQRLLGAPVSGGAGGLAPVQALKAGDRSAIPSWGGTWAQKTKHPSSWLLATNQGAYNKPGRQSGDDRTSRGIFKNSSVGLCRDSKELNNGALESCWEGRPGIHRSVHQLDRTAEPTGQTARNLHPTSKNSAETGSHRSLKPSLNQPTRTSLSNGCTRGFHAGNGETDAPGPEVVQVFLGPILADLHPCPGLVRGCGGSLALEHSSYSPGRSYSSSVRVSRNSSRIRMSLSIHISRPSRPVT